MRGIRGPAQVLTSGGKPDNYFGRLVKFIPAEVVALYVSAGGVVPKGHLHEIDYLWGIFVACVVITPLYMWVVARDEVTKKPIWKNITGATIAFPVWAFALGGPFAHLSWYEPFQGSLLLMFVTVGLGFLTP